MTYEEFFYELWNTMPETVVTEEYYDKNQDLFEAITYDFFQYNQNTGGLLNPTAARFALQQIISNILLFGVR